MGYINNEEKTVESIQGEKWVKTGDLGKLNEANHLHIVGRLKEIIVTAGGENVAPYPIENNIIKKLKDFVSWAVVVGDNRKFLVLLIAIRNAHSPTEVPSDEIEYESKIALAKIGIFAERISELFQAENFNKLKVIVEEAIDFANSHSISNASKIRKWCLLDRDFSIPTDEITPTLKLKRPKVEKHFAKKIEQLYNHPSL
jgi:long-chain-fatty-acid--CoA ligase ACSBG